MRVSGFVAATLVAAQNEGRVNVRHYGFVLSVIAMVLLGLVGLGSTGATWAQEATPLAGGLPFELAPGVTADILPENREMQRVCEKLGFRLTRPDSEPVARAVIDL